MGRANMLSTEGRVLKGMGVSKMPAWGEKELCIFTISPSRDKLGKAMSSIWPAAHEGVKSSRFRGNPREDVKRMSGNNVREVRDHGNAVPGIRSLVRRGVNGQGGMGKSRGRIRT
jgi:hypothetical protein